MSQIDKRICLDELRQRLGDIITANDVVRVVNVVDDILIDFDVVSVRSDSPDTDSEQLLEFFLTTIEIQGYAPKTVYGYKRILMRLYKETGVPFKKMRTEHIMEFLAGEKKRGISPVTIENYRHTFNSFFAWMIREEIITKDPMLRIMPFKMPDIMKLPFTDTELKKLDEAANSVRDRAIVAFLGATGCRVAEAVSVDRAEIDWQKNRLKVFGKGSKERMVYIDSVSAMLIQRYLNERTDDLPALWIGRGSERLTADQMRIILKKIGARAGVEGVHPHRFRRTLATRLLRAGMPLERVQKILGHAKITTTQKYIFVDDTDVANDYRKYA